MKYKFIYLTKSITIFALIVIGCEENSVPTSTISDIDTQLIGEWYYTDSLPMDYPAPQLAISGMQITKDKNINQLGIEIKTGKIVTHDESRYLELIKANNGILDIKVAAPPDIRNDTMHYEVRQGDLITSKEHFEKIYKKTKLGTQVATPISFDFTTMIDSIQYNGIEVHSYPTCFASKVSSTNLLITALIPHAQINIEINDFKGIGTYPILFGKGELVYNGSDYFLTFLSDSSNTGMVSINYYSETENICKGTFLFDGIKQDFVNNEWVIVRKKLRQGSFSLPIYK